MDEFFRRYFKGTSRYSALVEIFKFVLILSRGRAVINQGFSVNNIVLVKNLEEETLIGQRIDLVDLLGPIRANNYNPNIVPLIRELLISARNSHHACTQKLAERKELKNKTSQQLESINEAWL